MHGGSVLILASASVGNHFPLHWSVRLSGLHSTCLSLPALK